MEACRLPTFDVTQSMPACANTALCDIEENEGGIQSGISETEEDVCLLGTSQTPSAEALRDDLGNAEESEGEIQSGLPETKYEVCLLGTSEIQGAKALGSYLARTQQKGGGGLVHQFFESIFDIPYIPLNSPKKGGGRREAE